VSEGFQEQLAALASALRERREALFQAWEEAVRADPELAIASTLSLVHFRDLIGDVLDVFELQLRTASGSTASERVGEVMAEHGLHRWQQGYSLRELVREWGHLQAVVMAELEAYGLAHPGLEPEVMPRARLLWIRLCSQGISETVGQYANVQQAEAAGVLRDLQAAVEQVRELERQRAAGWHEAAHDLRGNVGVVTTATSLLAEDGVPEPLRAKALDTLQSGVSALHQLLEDLMSLARLEAGREYRQVAPFDAAALLRELCSMLEPVAAAKGLSLEFSGPEPLRVEGDAAKVRRIVQNLALNALKYTPQGRVAVTWTETSESDAERWRVRVEDTGPGLGLGAALDTPIGAKLREATEGALRTEERAATPDVEPVPAGTGPPPGPAAPAPVGEGIGLSIVKRLCELLDASLEIASTPAGTTFQVVLPQSYAQAQR
jgi:signal transduction histidine kinase